MTLIEPVFFKARFFFGENGFIRDFRGSDWDVDRIALVLLELE